VLARVCERLCGDEVGGGLDRRRRAAVEVGGDRGRQRAAVGQRLERGTDSPVGEHGWIDPAGQVAQVLQRLGHAGTGLGDELLCHFGVVAELLLGHPEAHAQRNQPRLGAVVQVALDAAQLGVLSLDRTAPARLERLDAAGEAAPTRASHDQVVHADCRGQPHQRPGRPERPAGGHRPHGDEEREQRGDDAAVNRESAGGAVRLRHRHEDEPHDRVDGEYECQRQQHPFRPEVAVSGRQIIFLI